MILLNQLFQNSFLNLKKKENDGDEIVLSKVFNEEEQENRQNLIKKRLILKSFLTLTKRKEKNI